MLNLQNDAVIICSSKTLNSESASGGSIEARKQIVNQTDHIEIEFSNLRSVELFGIDKTPLSTVQLTLR